MKKVRQIFGFFLKTPAIVNSERGETFCNFQSIIMGFHPTSFLHFICIIDAGFCNICIFLSICFVPGAHSTLKLSFNIYNDWANLLLRRVEIGFSSWVVNRNPHIHKWIYLNGKLEILPIFTIPKISSEKQASILDFTWFQSNTFPPFWI